MPLYRTPALPLTGISSIHQKVPRPLSPRPYPGTDFLVDPAVGLQQVWRDALQQVGRHLGETLPNRLDTFNALGGDAHAQGVKMQPGTSFRLLDLYESRLFLGHSADAATEQRRVVGEEV